MLEDLKNTLAQKEKELFESLFVHQKYNRKDMIIREGTIANTLFFIEKGSFRSYFVKDGEDITGFFFFENSFATDFASFYGNKPSLLHLEGLEDTIVSAISKEDLEKLYREHVHFSEIGRITAEYAFVLIEERIRLLHTESLETKYLWMLDNFPLVFQRVPQYHIASFLGVKPQSLSRIRAKVAGKEY